MPLTDTAIRNAKPRDKARKLKDALGLFLEITTAGTKRWRFRYRFADKEKMLSMGVYPAVGLAKARERRDDARRLLTDGIDPSAKRRQEKLLAGELATNSFEAIAREWYDKWSTARAPAHAQRVLTRLEKDLFPRLGKRPISEIDPPELIPLHTTRRCSVGYCSY